VWDGAHSYVWIGLSGENGPDGSGVGSCGIGLIEENGARIDDDSIPAVKTTPPTNEAVSSVFLLTKIN